MLAIKAASSSDRSRCESRNAWGLPITVPSVEIMVSPLVICVAEILISLIQETIALAFQQWEVSVVQAMFQSIA